MSDSDQQSVYDWYSDSGHIDEMPKGGFSVLKKWELDALEYFPDGGAILNIGCGMGREAFALYDKGYTVTGIDISEPIISAVSRHAEMMEYNIPFFLYDGHSFPFENESFDVVVIYAQTFGLLYGKKYKEEILNECCRVLNKNGLLIFSGHDSDYLKENYPDRLDGHRFFAYNDTSIYWETFHADELSEYAEASGFETIKCGSGEIYRPEDGTVLYCICKKK